MRRRVNRHRRTIREFCRGATVFPAYRHRRSPVDPARAFKSRRWPFWKSTGWRTWTFPVSLLAAGAASPTRAGVRQGRNHVRPWPGGDSRRGEGGRAPTCRDLRRRRRVPTSFSYFTRSPTSAAANGAAGALIRGAAIQAVSTSGGRMRSVGNRRKRLPAARWSKLLGLKAGDDIGSWWPTAAVKRRRNREILERLRSTDRPGSPSGPVRDRLSQMLVAGTNRVSGGVRARHGRPGCRSLLPGRSSRC